MKDELIYLASPYTSENFGEREQRAHKVAMLAGYLIAQGLNVFSPIAHSHYIANHSVVSSASHGGKDYEVDPVHKMWMKVDLAVLQHCDKMYVYCLPGWEESKGVQEEIEFCNNKGIPVVYLDTDGTLIRGFDGHSE